MSFHLTLNQLISQRALLNHSFYQRWQMGQLSLDELRGYAKEYYVFEKEFPRFLSSLHSKCTNQEIRQKILQNLIHEEHGPENHPELWLKFAEGLGLDREEVKNHFHSDETEHLLRTFRKYCYSGTLEQGMAALYSYEQQQPAVAEQKIDGLKKNYQISDDQTLAFFKAHQHYDIEHSDTEAEVLNQICISKESQESSQYVVEEVTAALYDFLSGVEKRYQIAA